jgi:pSer/pThr/pTyr-binding forkhead associated (FHA) protein
MTVVGRREDCDLRIPLGEISRKHCRFIKDGDSLRIEDLGSSNGTFHNGERVQEAIVGPGDTVQVGSIAFVVQIDGAPVDEELTPVRASTQETSKVVSEVDADGSGGEIPMDEPADSGAIPIGDQSASGAVAATSDLERDGNADAEEFDPMAFLTGGDSQGPGASGANIDSDQSKYDADVDAEQSNYGQNAEA